MKIRQCTRIRSSFLIFLLAALQVNCAFGVVSSEPEISIMINEPWEDMRQRSSAELNPVAPGKISHTMPTSDARLRFNDPKFGFVTPLARYIDVTYANERVGSIRMIPQTEPLRLDDALKVVIDLQDQWREKGWLAVNVRDTPPIADTPEWRRWFRDGEQHALSFWLAADKYKVVLILEPFDDLPPHIAARYLITLTLGEQWVPSDEGEFDLENKPVTPLLPSKTNSRSNHEVGGSQALRGNDQKCCVVR